MQFLSLSPKFTIADIIIC